MDEFRKLNNKTEWVEVFENRSSVMSEMGIIPLSADIQPFTFCSDQKRILTT